MRLFSRGYVGRGLFLAKIMLVGAAYGLFSQASGQVALTIASGAGTPGATVNLNLQINSTGMQPASLQWTMNYAAADVTSINVTAGAVATAAGKSVSCNIVSAGTLNCIVFGLNSTPISNGVIATAAVTLSPTTTSTSTGIVLTGAIASSGDNPPVALVATPASPNTLTGTITINQPTPTLVSVTVATNPASLQVTVDGTTYTAPRTFQWAIGSNHTIATTSPQGSGSTRYVFDNWSDGGAISHTVTTPALAATVTASFTTQYQLTTGVSPAGAGTVSPASGSFYNAGSSVQLTASPNSGQQFSGWSGDVTGTANPTSVAMNGPRSVVANFTAASQGVTVNTSPSGLQIVVDGTTYTAPRTFQWTVGSNHTIATTSPQGSGSTRYVFANWSDGGAISHTVTTPASATTVTASFTTQYQLTTAVSPAGAGTVSPASGSFYNAGSTVQISASPNSGQQFTGWSGDVTSTTNPLSLSMSGPRSVTANFTAAAQGITISTSPSGLQIIVDGTTYTAPRTFQWTPGSNHTVNTPSPQGSGTTRYVFASWSDGASQSRTITTPSSPTNYTATFTTQYQLLTSVTPAGSGTVAPASGSFYNAGSTVQVSATPNSGQQFNGWSGDATGTTNPLTVTMSAPRNVVANFGASPQNITVTTSPSGLQIVVDGTAYTAPRTFQWTPGTNHTVNVPSPQGTGSTRYVYASWSDGGAQTHTVTAPSSAATYTASFNPQYQLTTSVTPAASGTVSPASGSYYNAGAVVSVTALPNSGQQFTGWSGDVTGSTNPLSVTMSAPRNVVANFAAASQGITISTVPSGLQIVVDGTSYTAPRTFQWSAGSTHTVNAPSPQGTGSTRYVYANWSDGGTQSRTITTPSSPTTYVANFSTQYQLTTAASPTNAGTVSPASGTFYNAGTTVQLSANPNSGQQFTSWSGDATGDTNPVSITMSGPRSITANFSASQNGVTIHTSPSGLQIVVDGTTYTAPRTFQWTPGTTHSIGTTSPQGSGTTRYVFANWSNNGGQTQTITAPTVATTYVVNFTTQYQLTTSSSPANGGTVTPSGSTFHNVGAVVSLNAAPNSGQQFTSWSGDASGTSNPTSVTMSGPRNITGNFTTAGQGITVTTAPLGRQIVVDGVPYTSPQTFQWTAGSSHTISVTSPQTSSGTRYVFSNWSDGGAQTHSITTPAAATTYLANFTTQYQLLTSVSPAGSGRVQVSPAAADGFYTSGATVQVTAVGNPGFQFTSWSGGASGSSTSTSLSITAPVQVTANFGGLSDSCSIQLNRNTFAAASEGDVGRVNVKADSGCAWSTSSSVSWITINTGITGSGNGSVGFSVLSNYTPSPRTGTLTIGGQSLAITQANSNCGSNITITNAVQPAVSSSGSNITLNVNAPASCLWSASTPSSWLTLTSPVNNSGAGAVQFQVAPNPDPNPRMAAVQIGGAAATILQRGVLTQVFYSDVLPENIFYPNIGMLIANSIDSGCSPSLFCPDQIATRADIAPLVIRTLFGDNFSYTQTPYFTDVPVNHPQFRFIQKMRDLNITIGCSATAFCPQDPVTRGQMAAFLIRAKVGGAGAPITGGSIESAYPVSPFFVDVPTSHPFFPFVQKIKQLGVTYGCTEAQYCADGLTRRGEAAAFVTRSFLAQ